MWEIFPKITTRYKGEVMNELLNIDLTQLSYGGLFVWLLFDTNKKNEQREKK